MPGISVIVPAYNAEKYLKNCVESVRNQTFQDWELLIVDDGSKDRTREIAMECAAGDDRVRVLRKKNGGVSSARNLGCGRRKGSTSPSWTPTTATSAAAWRRCGPPWSSPERTPPPAPI